MKFYCAKEVYLEIGITSTTLYSRVAKGVYPPFERSPLRKNGVGYSEKNMKIVRKIVAPKAGRPKLNIKPL